MTDFPISHTFYATSSKWGGRSSRNSCCSLHHIGQESLWTLRILTSFPSLTWEETPGGPLAMYCHLPEHPRQRNCMWTSVSAFFQPLGDNCPLDDEWLLNGGATVSAGIPGAGPEWSSRATSPASPDLWAWPNGRCSQLQWLSAHARPRRICPDLLRRALQDQ